MEPIVDLAPGADENPLAVSFADRVRENVKRPDKRGDFREISVAVKGKPNVTLRTRKGYYVPKHN